MSVDRSLVFIGLLLLVGLICMIAACTSKVVI